MTKNITTDVGLTCSILIRLMKRLDQAIDKNGKVILSRKEVRAVYDFIDGGNIIDLYGGNAGPDNRLIRQRVVCEDI